MSNYRQQYSVPYSGGVSAGGPGNTLSDNFDQSRPAFQLVPGAADVPGYAAIDSKWKRLDIDNVFLRVAAVDTRLQMALLEGSGKGVCGLYQQLPLPGEHETIDLAIYAQSRLAALYQQPEGPEAVLGPAFAGIFIADDLDANPTTSQIYMMGGVSAVNTSNTGRAAVSVNFAAFDALPTAIIEAEQDFCFQRIRIRQQLDNGLWNIQVALEAGAFGSDWLPFGFLQIDAALQPFKSAGFGVFAGDGAVTQIQLDNFIVNVEDFGPGYSGVMGGIQQLGAV